MDSRRVGPAIPPHRLHDCVTVLLSYQNGDGGWATYENKRSFDFLEVPGGWGWGWGGCLGVLYCSVATSCCCSQIITVNYLFTPLTPDPSPHPPQIVNPSETFGEIMVDYNHVECSSACITALAAFAATHPQHRSGEIAGALRRGIRYLKRWAGGGGGGWGCGVEFWRV